ncbi:MAG TPA: hypothetical protein VGL09_20365, partial [Methylomirabilota bacterium]
MLAESPIGMSRLVALTAISPADSIADLAREMVLPHTNLGQAIFAAGGRTYDWGDVLLAAKLSGDWRDLETEIREGLACLARAE